MSDSEDRFLERRGAAVAEVRRGHHAWFVLRAMRRAFTQQIAQLDLSAGARVLDFGCAESPYRNLFPPGCTYVGADLPGNANAQVLINADGTLPAGDASFDVVLSTQVLEHVSHPEAYLRECERVLRPGGHLLLSTHGFWVYHRDPVDYWRWTGDGLKVQIERSRLEVRAVSGVGGLAAVAVQLFQDATARHLPRFLQYPYLVVMQQLAAALDLLHSPVSRSHNAMVLIALARKMRP